MNIQDVIKRNTALLNGSQSKNWFAVSLVISQGALVESLHANSIMQTEFQS